MTVNRGSVWSVWRGGLLTVEDSVETGDNEGQCISEEVVLVDAVLNHDVNQESGAIFRRILATLLYGLIKHILDLVHLCQIKSHNQNKS